MTMHASRRGIASCLVLLLSINVMTMDAASGGRGGRHMEISRRHNVGVSSWSTLLTKIDGGKSWLSNEVSSQQQQQQHQHQASAATLETSRNKNTFWEGYGGAADEWTKTLVRNIMRRENIVVNNGDSESNSTSDISDCTVSVSADGSTVAVGATWADDAGLATGHRRVRVYRQGQRGSWARLGGIVGFSQDEIQDQSSVSAISLSLSSDGTTIAIGEVLDADGLLGIVKNKDKDKNNKSKKNKNSRVHPARLRVFRYLEGDWIKVGQDIGYRYYDYRHGNGGWSSGVAAFSVAAGEMHSSAVSLSEDGKAVAIGEPHFGEVLVVGSAEGSAARTKRSHSGRVRVFRYQDSESSSSSNLSSKGKKRWELVGESVRGRSPGERLGHSVALSGDGNSVAVGAMTPPQSLQGERYAGIAGDTSAVTDCVRVYQNMQDSWHLTGETLLAGGKNNNGSGGGAGNVPPSHHHRHEAAAKPNATKMSLADQNNDGHGKDNPQESPACTTCAAHWEDPIERDFGDSSRSTSIFDKLSH